MCNQCAKSTGNDNDANGTIAAMPSARLRRNDFQTWDGGRLPSPCILSQLAGNAKGEAENQSVFERNGSLLNAMSRKAEESHNQTDLRYIRRHPQHDRFPVRRLSLAAQLGGYSTDRRCHDSTRSPAVPVTDLTTATHRLAF
jgi:hypothetical protein